MNKSRIIPLAAIALTFTTTIATAQFQTFEGDGFGNWQAEGSAFGLSPVHEKIDWMKNPFTGFSNEAFAASVYGGTKAVGTLSSQEFEIKNNYIIFLVAGGDQLAKTSVQLIIDGAISLQAVGKNNLAFDKIVWDVSKLRGRKAIIRLVDNASDEWGFIAADHFIFSNSANGVMPATTKNGKPVASGLVPTTTLPGAIIPKDSILRIEASHDDLKITSPTALTFDEKGNIYVSETHRFRKGIEDDRNHLYWYLDDLAAQTTDDRRALHKKWEKKLSHKYMTAVSEVIRRFADTDQDGIIDDSKVFADSFNDVLDGTAAGVFSYDGALYFACIPKIYKLLDENNDGISDKRVIVEEGFGVRISLSGHDLNGFTLGPDGRIYGTIGDRGFSLKTKEGKELHYPNEGAAFRFEPDGTNFELMHTGLRNPKEIVFDELGNAFTVDNNSDQGDAARILYLVEGGDSGWQMEHQAMHTFHREIGLVKRPLSRWMDEKMWELRNDKQPAYILPPSAHLTAGPSGLTYHPGIGFLENEKGRFLVCDYKGSASASGIWSFAMEPDGAGMTMTDSQKFIWGVAATDIEYSFDGRLFVTDFVTGWQSHDEGRLLSLDAGENTYEKNQVRSAAEIISKGFDDRSSDELTKLLNHPDSRVRLRAQISLTRKSDAVASFKKATESKELLQRIHGIWGLGIVARRGSVPSPTGKFATIPSDSLRQSAFAVLIDLLQDPDPEIRTQILRVIADAPFSGEALPLGTLLHDPSPRVRFAAGIAIGKLKAIGHYSAVLDFIKKNNNRDAYLRHAGIYALEHIVKDHYQLGALFSFDSPAVRLAAVVALRRLKSEEIARFINDPDPTVQDEVIRAICDLDLQNIRPLAAALLDNVDSRKWSPMILRRLVNNSYRLGTDDNASRILNVIANTSIPSEVREEALRLLTIWEQPHPVDPVTAHFRPLEKRDITTFKPILNTALPSLLKAEGFVLTGALDLIEHYHLNVAELDATTLRILISNPELPAEARAKALAIYAERKEPALAEYLIEISNDPADLPAIKALEILVSISPETALPALEKSIETGTTARAQKAWENLAKIPGADSAAFISKNLTKLKETNGLSPTGVEILAVAAQRQEQIVKDALTAYEKHITESKDTLAKYNITLQGGDPKKGALLFNSHPAGQCMRCHKANEYPKAEGGDAGPNLAGIGKKHDSKYLLQALVEPAAVVAPGYGVVTVTFKNGAILGGTLVEETPDHLTIIAPDNTWLIKRTDIASFTPPASAMPPMGFMMQPAEIRDLVAWLGSLDKIPAKKSPAKPETLDPSKLPGAKY
jgi:quinoprotein glucose dehydrogenase